jgi:Fe-S cluster biogenesis protein NfuA
VDDGADGRRAEDLGATGDRIEELYEQLRVSTDPATFERAEELLRMITELYGDALARVVALARAEAPELLPVLVDDELLGSLMIVHDLHPDTLASRVEVALESVRPYLHGHGGDVQLLELDAARGAVHLQLLGSCDGCPSSSVTLRTAVETAIADAAPEIVVIDVEEQATGSGVTTPVELGRRPAVGVR